jgi:hypothetical protein
MTATGRSIAKALGIGIVLSMPLIAIIEGWPIAVTVGGTAALFLLGGLVDAWWQQVPLWWSTLIVCAPGLLGLNAPSGLVLCVPLLLSPGTIDERNFYELLPLLGLVSAFLGAAIGRASRRFVRRPKASGTPGE